MKALKNTDKDKIWKNVPILELTGVVLVHSKVVNNKIIKEIQKCFFATNKSVDKYSVRFLT